MPAGCPHPPSQASHGEPHSRRATRGTTGCCSSIRLPPSRSTAWRSVGHLPALGTPSRRAPCAPRPARAAVAPTVHPYGARRIAACTRPGAPVVAGTAGRGVACTRRWPYQHRGDVAARGGRSHRVFPGGRVGCTGGRRRARDAAVGCCRRRRGRVRLPLVRLGVGPGKSAAPVRVGSHGAGGRRRRRRPPDDPAAAAAADVFFCGCR